ncbi:transposase [Actinoplanes sp. CA-030573]|uniref:transposase n=1 Tax=Actinoplanes sp. CA-030573 TaxID=3239898 RepID=UPI003D89E5BD
MPPILAERLADRIDAVIGVDTHTDTHTAAVLTPVGTVVAELTVAATAEGAATLLAWAEQQTSGRGSGRRAWALDSARSHGVGLLRISPGRPRRRFDTLLADKGYDSEAFRHACRRRGIEPIIPKRKSTGVKGLGKLRYVVEQSFALLHQFRRLAVRWERRLDIHDSLVSLACALICWRRLINWTA